MDIYFQIELNHLTEETHSYMYVWKFPENIYKYSYGGLSKMLTILRRTGVIMLKYVMNMS